MSSVGGSPIDATLSTPPMRGVSWPWAEDAATAASVKTATATKAWTLMVPPSRADVAHSARILEAAHRRRQELRGQPQDDVRDVLANERERHARRRGRFARRSSPVSLKSTERKRHRRPFADFRPLQATPGLVDGWLRRTRIQLRPPGYSADNGLSTDFGRAGRTTRRRRRSPGTGRGPI